MKDFNKYFESLHPSTQLAIVSKYTGTPVGVDTYDSALKNNPECFPEEIAHREKWASVPEDIKDKYFKEIGEVDSEYYDNAPHAGMGIVWYIQHPKEHQEREDYLTKNRDNMRKQRKQIHNKYLRKYGIEFMY